MNHVTLVQTYVLRGLWMYFLGKILYWVYFFIINKHQFVGKSSSINQDIAMAYVGCFN